jgi:predicted TIM-barrel fold metal-dependent hydrolase
VAIPQAGAIDCDIHVAVPDGRVLLPHFDEYWREHVLARGLERENFQISAYPPEAPSNVRPGWKPVGADLATVQAQALDAFGTKYAICNVLHGAPIMFSEDMAAAFCRAINNWVAAEFLDRDPRLRASILVPIHSPDLAAQEIERLAGDARFVQVLLLVMAEMPLGRRANWPIYRAAERHDLAIAIHAGSAYRHAPTSTGWPSTYLEDMVAQSQGFAAAVTSLVTEGVFLECPRLKVVLLESGVTWLPSYLWRLDKTWRGVRAEVPWLDRAPSAFIRDNVRLTIQPFDAPPQATQLHRIIEQIGSDAMLLFATDYPHWHFDGTDALPDGLSPALTRKILVDNALSTYPRLNREMVR